METTIFIISIVVIILCYEFSKECSYRLEVKYHRSCISWWRSIVIACLLAVTMVSIGGKYFAICLILTLCVSAFCAWMSYEDMTANGATSADAVLGGLAQVAYAVGIAAAIIFFLLLFADTRNKKRRK